MSFFFFFREFKIEDGKAVIPLGITVQGDVLIVIYHARSTLGGRLQAKVIDKFKSLNGGFAFFVAVLYPTNYLLSTLLYLLFSVHRNV